MKKKVYYKLNRYKVAKVEVESVEQEQAVKILNRETDRFAKSEDTYYCSIFSNQNILAIKQIAVNVIQYSSSAIIWEITLSIETLST